MLGDYVRKLQREKLDDVYRLFEDSFVPAELRPYQAFKDLFEQGSFDLYGYEKDSQLLGAMIVWEFETFAYIENFAVNQQLRGQGTGSKMLDDIENMMEKPLVLEVEVPYDDMSHRRVVFYQRNQFLYSDYGYIQPALRENVPDVQLQLMSYPKIMTAEEFEKMKKQIFQKVYNKYEESI